MATPRRTTPRVGRMNRRWVAPAVGHTMALTADRARSRKPSPGSGPYDLLDAASDAAPRDAHFSLGVDSLVDGHARALGDH